MHGPITEQMRYAYLIDIPDIGLGLNELSDIGLTKVLLSRCKHMIIVG